MTEKLVEVDRHVRVVRDGRIVVRRPGDRITLAEALDLGLTVERPPKSRTRLPAGWTSDGRPSLWFVVPARRRFDLARACFAALASTCERLDALGVHASAVVVADDDNLQAARDHGFATVLSANDPLGRRWNDGYQFAGEAGIDYVIPFGSDDIVDADVVADSLPKRGEITCFRKSAVVSADGLELALLTVPYTGGDGVKIIPASLIEPLEYRPLDDRRSKAMDGSMVDRLARHGRRPRYVYRDAHPTQIVDFKSPVDQLTRFDDLVRDFADQVLDDPFGILRDVYPDDVLAPIQAVYSRGQVAA